MQLLNILRKAFVFIFLFILMFGNECRAGLADVLNILNVAGRTAKVLEDVNRAAKANELADRVNGTKSIKDKESDDTSKESDYTLDSEENKYWNDKSITYIIIPIIIVLSLTVVFMIKYNHGLKKKIAELKNSRS